MAPVPKRGKKLSDLPDVFLEDIVLRLSVKQVVQARLISRSWNALLRSDQFHRRHFKKCMETKEYRLLIADKEEGTRLYMASLYQRETFSNALLIRHPPLRSPRRYTVIVGVANGLVCLRYMFSHQIVIWNPIINRSLLIAAIETELDAVGESVNYSFGYDKINRDYKIVGVDSQVRIYSLSTNSWKTIPHPGFSHFGRSVYLDGKIHWLVGHDPKKVVIVILDLNTQVFSLFVTPFDDGQLGIGLGVLGGNLCLIFYHGGERNEVWQMNQDGVVGSWEHFFSVPCVGVLGTLFFEGLTPLLLSNTCTRVLLFNDTEDSDGAIFWYNFMTNSGRVAGILGLPEHFDAAICEATLIDPSDFVRHRQLLPRPSRKEEESGKQVDLA